ncbi:hypothetical protein OHAE_420 [Ochrobactrum soli]|uniref:Uncharacterized protein n=1 Tax=Ochrobactrum soli TaxID=2448455 RepID=A0A2P9HKN9_9HYPH|nr:hypothetical protein OHAE_420 [[Ochrobactrum] soli]
MDDLGAAHGNLAKYNTYIPIQTLCRVNHLSDDGWLIRDGKRKGFLTLAGAKYFVS